MLYHALVILAAAAVAWCDVSHLSSTTTEPPPPKPYAFSYTAGRYPGHADRQHTEVSDGSGVIRGTFSYVDPRQKVRTVDYVADKEGFHPVLSDSPPEHPADSEAVAREKDRHYHLYAKIAEDHANNPHPDAGIQVASPRQSAAVAAATANHLQLFRVIAEQHARIAAERDQLQREDEERQHLQDLEEPHH